MRLSVIVPVYNTDRFLSKCIDSILAQAEPDMELILVDDGSTDCSFRICKYYASKFEEIVGVHISNSGPATAKNVGLKMATGDYVSFIDSDDYLLPDMYSTLLELAYTHNADIVCCSYKQIDENGVWTHTESSGELCVFNREQGVKHLLDKDKIYSQCWTKIYKKKILDDYQINFIDGLRTEEDFLFNIETFVISNVVVLIDKPFYIYTHRNASLSREYHKQQLECFCRNMVYRLDYTENLVRKTMPCLTNTCTRHCIAYYNLMMGRVVLSSSAKDYMMYFKIGHRYIKKHCSVLFAYYKSCGFSVIGAIILCLLPSKYYYYYRILKK